MIGSGVQALGIVRAQITTRDPANRHLRIALPASVRIVTLVLTANTNPLIEITSFGEVYSHTTLDT